VTEQTTHARIAAPAWTPETALPWVQRWDTLMTGFWPWRAEVQQTVVELLDRLGVSGRVLELGAGPGSFAVRLAGRPSDVVAMDWDPLVLGLARAHLAGRATVFEADLTQRGWASGVHGRFDAVVTSAVLHMVEASAYKAIAGEVASVLRPGGVFVDVDEMPLGPCIARLATVAAGLREARATAWFSSHHEDFQTWMTDLRAQPQSAPLLALQRDRFGSRVARRVARADERVAALRTVGFTEAVVVERRLDTAVVMAVLGTGAS